MRFPQESTACKAMHEFSSNQQGQSTVEFALVLAVSLVVFSALGLFWRVFEQGVVIEHALSAASHHFQGANPGVLFDIFAV